MHNDFSMTRVHVSPLFILMAVVLILLGYTTDFICYFCTVILHEMSHAETASKLGYTLNGIKLMPYGASLTGSFEGLRARDEIFIALAGPIFNVILAIIIVALWWIFPSIFLVTQTFVSSNVYTAVINLIPIFPLDGGRVCLAIFSNFFKREKVYSVMRKIGIAVAIIFSIMFLISLFRAVNPTFATFALFILFSTIVPDNKNKYTRLYSMAYRSEKLKHGLPVKKTAFADTVKLGYLFNALKSNNYNCFIILNSQFKQIAEIDETQLEKLLASFGYDYTVKDAIKFLP